MKRTIFLTSDELKNIIEAYLDNKTLISGNDIDITFDIKEITVGFQPDSYKEHQLTGVTIEENI